MKQLVQTYQESLRLTQERITELLAERKKPDITPAEKSNLDVRLHYLWEERAELREDIADMLSYLKARGETA